MFSVEAFPPFTVAPIVPSSASTLTLTACDTIDFGFKLKSIHILEKS